MKNKFSAESGNAVLFILIAVILFAALGYTFTRGAQQGSGNISKQQAKMYASDIISYAQAVEQAVNRVRNKGCSENQINFYNTVVAGYTNPNAPGDNSCDVFNSAGGKIEYIAPNTNWLDGKSTAKTDYGTWFIPQRTCVLNVGAYKGNCTTDGSSTSEDLVLILPYISKSLCIALNEHLGVANPSDNPPVESGNAWTIGNPKFTGTFLNNASIDFNPGKYSGCFEGDTTFVPAGGTYHFYYVLLAR